MTKYFTPAALALTKCDLGKLGIDSKSKLSRPFPANLLVCWLIVVVREKDGIRRNEITNLEVIRVLDPADNSAAPVGDGDTSFPFGQNEIPL